LFTNRGINKALIIISAPRYSSTVTRTNGFIRREVLIVSQNSAKPTTRTQTETTQPYNKLNSKYILPRRLIIGML